MIVLRTLVGVPQDRPTRGLQRERESPNSTKDCYIGSVYLMYSKRESVPVMESNQIIDTLSP